MEAFMDDFKNSELVSNISKFSGKLLKNVNIDFDALSDLAGDLFGDSNWKVRDRVILSLFDIEMNLR